MKTILALVLFVLASMLTAQDLKTVYNEGMKAYEDGNFELFLTSMKIADSLSPEHPTITYNLAAALAKNSHFEQSKGYLTKVIHMNTAFKPEEDGDFEGMDLSFLKQLKESLNEIVSKGEIVFTNDEIDLHPESVAYDSRSKSFFLNSVRKGKIIRYENEEFSEFTSKNWAVMGMKVHGKHLWACVVATPELIEYDEKDEGKTALIQFDLKSGKALNQYELEGGHWFGDLIFKKDGSPLISDSMKPIVYTVENNELKVFRDFTGELYNLQGLAMNDDESLLYIADYKLGLHLVDLKTDRVSKLDHPTTMLTKGTDGLYFHKNTLIAIQNGVKPFRVSRFQLSSSGKSIEAVEYLDKARPEMDEPTLGVLIDDELYYVSNSPWGAYKDGQFVKEGLKENIVMKISLK